eukprot:scaffold1311_cov256-Pinguiococcus_pyrenoidosus.AAC.67
MVADDGEGLFFVFRAASLLRCLHDLADVQPDLRSDCRVLGGDRAACSWVWHPGDQVLPQRNPAAAGGARQDAGVQGHRRDLHGVVGPPRW